MTTEKDLDDASDIAEKINDVDNCKSMVDAISEGLAKKYEKGFLAGKQQGRDEVLREAEKLRDALTCAPCTCHPPMEFVCPRCVALKNWQKFKEGL